LLQRPDFAPPGRARPQVPLAAPMPHRKGLFVTAGVLAVVALAVEAGQSAYYAAAWGVGFFDNLGTGFNAVFTILAPMALAILAGTAFAQTKPGRTRLLALPLGLLWLCSLRGIAPGLAAAFGGYLGGIRGLLSVLDPMVWTLALMAMGLTVVFGPGRGLPSLGWGLVLAGAGLTFVGFVLALAAAVSHGAEALPLTLNMADRLVAPASYLQVALALRRPAA
jgi:hypothetical protein